MNTLTNLVLYVSYPETGFGVMLLISQALGIPPICEVGNPLIHIEIGIKTSTSTQKKLLVHSGPDPSNSILVLVARSHHHQTSAHRN